MNTKQTEFLAHYKSNLLTIRKERSLGTSTDKVVEFIASPRDSIPEKAFEVGYFCGDAKPKDIINISSQIGCHLNCQFCNSGARSFVSNLTPEQMEEQVILALQIAQKNGIDIFSSSKKYKISIAKTGEPLYNKNIVEALGKISRISSRLGLCPFSFKISTTFPANKIGQFKKIAKFAASYPLAPVQMQISLISTSQKYREKIVGAKLSSFQKIVKIAEYWQKNVPHARRINLSLVLSEKTPCNVKDIVGLFPPELFHFRFRECVETKNAKRGGLKQITASRMTKLKKEFSEKGYDVDDHATPTQTEQDANLASNVLLEEYLEDLKNEKK